jgi:hypothetical protein
VRWNSGQKLIDRKRLLYTEAHFEKNHRTTAAQMTAELNIRLEDPVSTKTVQ